MLRAELGHSFDDLKESFRDAQTELLKAFYNYALPLLGDPLSTYPNLKQIKGP